MSNAFRPPALDSRSWNFLCLIFRRPEEATKQEKACLSTWSLQRLQLQVSPYTNRSNNSTTSRSSSSQTSQPFTHRETKANKKVSYEVIARCKTTAWAIMQEPRKKEREKIYQQEQTRPRRSSTLSLTRPVAVSVKIIAAATSDQRGGRWSLCDNRSIVTKADEALFAVKWLAFRAMGDLQTFKACFV